MDKLIPLWEHLDLRIISERRIKEFGEEYPDAAVALANWKRAVRVAHWRHQSDVKAHFSNSDLVGEKTVFNIANNRYRLIAFINFRAQILFVKQILAHSEYDKGRWKQ
jgi:mRNA interferase HigB